MKLKFIKYKDRANKFDTTSVYMISTANHLPDILEDFADFLRASGFTVDGAIEVVPRETDGEAAAR